MEFLRTKNGQAFIDRFMKNGQSLTIKIGNESHVYTTKKDGEFANDLLARGSAENLGIKPDGKVTVGRIMTTDSGGKTELGKEEYGGNDNSCYYSVQPKA